MDQWRMHLQSMRVPCRRMDFRQLRDERFIFDSGANGGCWHSVDVGLRCENSTRKDKLHGLPCHFQMMSGGTRKGEVRFKTPFVSLHPGVSKSVVGKLTGDSSPSLPADLIYLETNSFGQAGTLYRSRLQIRKRR
jgi:hypothetical protein